MQGVYNFICVAKEVKVVPGTVSVKYILFPLYLKLEIRALQKIGFVDMAMWILALWIWYYVCACEWREGVVHVIK